MRAIALGLIVAASWSVPGFAAEPEGPESLITQSEAVRINVVGQLSADSAKPEEEALLRHYSAQDSKLLWVDETGLTRRAKMVMAEIGKADDYGLSASDYALPDAGSVNGSGPGAPERLADAEVKVSKAVVAYARDARGGRLDPVRLSKNLDPTLALPDPLEVIQSIAIRSNPGAYLRSFQPDQPQFEALRKKLLELRGGKTEEPKPVVTIPEGPALKLGVAHEQVALLRKRLDVTGAAQDGTPVDETMFDQAVFDAVRQFQIENGIAADGVVGRGTRQILNHGRAAQATDSQATIRTILTNMERWRWLPHDLGPFYATVNVPEFTLRVVEEGKPIHTARVVVGKVRNQTPVFSEDMKEIVFNPYWNVPTSIKNEEIAPYFGGGFFGGYDTSVLARHNLRLRYGNREIHPDTVDWTRMSLRNFDLVQPPGPGNVLGKVKFLFPNSHDVYMHDTTQKHLFANSVRAESHGCMRVQNPDKFAKILLKHANGWSEQQVMSAWHGADDNKVMLDRKIPVHITYFTMWVNEDGSISTFRDLYGHDARMHAALTGQGYAPEPVYQDAVATNQGRFPPRRGRRGNSFSNDFTRALFGF